MKRCAKYILIYYVGYVTIKKDLKIYSINSFYLIFGNGNGYFEEINGNEYLTLVPVKENKEKIKKYEELWIKIRDLIRSITKKYLKIKSDSDDELPLNKIIEIPVRAIVVTAVFLENNKYNAQVLLDECL